MTTAAMNKSDLMAPPVAEQIQTRSIFIGLIGVVASVAGAFLAPQSFYSAYLEGLMVWILLARDVRPQVLFGKFVLQLWGKQGQAVVLIPGGPCIEKLIRCRQSQNVILVQRGSDAASGLLRRGGS